MSTNQRVVILSAIPGAGKSTHARKLVEQNGSGTILCVDTYFTNKETGNYEFQPSLLQNAYAEHMRLFIEAVQRGDSLIVVDNPNTSIEQISPYYAVAKAFGVRNVRIVMIKCPLNLAFQRNIHQVPHAHIQQHNERFKQIRIPKPWKVEIEMLNVQED